jgi:hypothetical protein
MGKVIFSEGESTIHVRLGPKEVLSDGTILEPHESKLLLPGEMITLDEVPDYLVDLVKKGKAPGLVLIDESKAKALVDQINLVKGASLISDSDNNSEVDTEESDILTPELV